MKKMCLSIQDCNMCYVYLKKSYHNNNLLSCAHSQYIYIIIFYEIEIVYNILYNKIYTRYKIIYDIIFYLFITVTIMLKYCVLFSSIFCVYYS